MPSAFSVAGMLALSSAIPVQGAGSRSVCCNGGGWSAAIAIGNLYGDTSICDWHLKFSKLAPRPGVEMASDSEIRVKVKVWSNAQHRNKTAINVGMYGYSLPNGHLVCSARGHLAVSGHTFSCVGIRFFPGLQTNFQWAFP